MLSCFDCKELTKERRILIKSIDGEIFSLIMKNHDLIRDIKMKFYDEIGLIVDEQILIYQGEILDDMMTLNDYEIINDSLIEVVGRLRGGMQIVIKLTEGTRIKIEINETDKVKNLKLRIQEIIKMLPHEQILVYRGNVLDDDDKTFVDYEIESKSVINVVAKLRIQIFVKTADGNNVGIDVQKFDEILDLKKKIQEKIGLQLDEQILTYKDEILDNNKTIDAYRICEKSVINVLAILKIQILFKRTDGKTIEMKVQRFQKIIDLKNKIKDKIELNADKQKMVYQDVILDDDNKSIDEYQICNQSIIDILAKILISITTSGGRNTTVEIYERDKIKDLKCKIVEKIGLDANKQKLIYQGVILNDDERAIDEYGICEESVITVVAKITIFVKRCTETMITIEIYETDKIKDLKDKIQDKLKLNLNKQKLVYEESILDDVEKTIDEYQICDQSVIHLRHNEIKISIKWQNEKIFIIKALMSYKILDLKLKIEDQTGLKPDEQVLIYKNEILDVNDKTIDEYQICDPSLINLETKLKNIEKQIIVRTIDEKTVKIITKTFDKIIDLKHKIEKQTRLHPNEQILIYQGRILNDDEKTIDEYDICDQSIINVITKISIFVSIGDRITIVEIYKTDKIKDLKYKIQEKLGFNRNKQKFVFHDKILDDDEKTIDEYQICNQSIIYLRCNKIEIAITMPNNKKIVIQVQELNKIEEIKKKISRQTVFQSNDQILIYQGEKLDDNKTIDEYGICDGSVIHLQYGMGLFVKTPDGKIITCKVKKSNKIIDVKKKIQEKIGLHSYEQIMIYQGAMLKNKKRIDQYEICDKSVVTIVARLKYDEIQINVKTVNGRTIFVDVKKSQKVIDIKEKIQQRLGLRRDEQILIYQDEILGDDEKIIDEYQICNLSVIYVSCRNEWS